MGEKLTIEDLFKLATEGISNIEESKKDKKINDLLDKIVEEDDLNEEVFIYIPYENNTDLANKIKELIDIFGEEIVNDLYTDDEKLLEIRTFKTITQSEIIDLFCAFDTRNIRFDYDGETLWIILNDCI